MKLICPTCRKIFKPTRKGQKYCSPECAPFPHKLSKPKTYVCENCGKEFTSYWSKARFCSRKCTGEYNIQFLKNGPFIRTCRGCMGLFITNDPGKKYCSLACRQKGPLVRDKFICPHCGLEVINPYPNQLTCGSRACMVHEYIRRREELARRIGKSPYRLGREVVAVSRSGDLVTTTEGKTWQSGAYNWPPVFAGPGPADKRGIQGNEGCKENSDSHSSMARQSKNNKKKRHRESS
jgi:hypothetical protein